MVLKATLAALPDIEGLRKLTQSLAMLDAIMSPEWEYRYYSFNSKWDDGEMMASMRNGSGDEYFILVCSLGSQDKNYKQLMTVDSMNFRFFNGGTWDIQRVKPPWGDRRSIYQHILAKIRSGQPGLGEEGELLPDDEIVKGDNRFRWAPGALDGVFGHHGGGTAAADAARKILESFRALAKKANDDRADSLYSMLVEHSALGYVDHLLETVVADDDLDAERLQTIARWVATGAADREPIKCAIALLGVFQGGEDRDLLLTLGRHEEFTLFASVALKNSGDDPELSLWALACLVTGWGRIQIIQRLAETKDEQIKAWMLREGYRNDIMEEYTALICARTGDLLSALRKLQPDEKLLKGAGSLLTTLIRGRGGPSEGIESYVDGAEATELYLQHLQSRDLDLEDFIAVSAIELFLNEEEGEVQDPALGWPKRRATLLDLTGAIRSRPGWEEKVREGLDSQARQTFWTATEAARVLGIDTWDIYFERLKRGEDQWYFVMQTNDHERIDKVVQFAEETVPLQEIASGPADSLGLGPEFQHHSALDFVLQDLRRFPSKGWPLIRAGLQSPVVRNRNMAIQALAAWDRTAWPVEAEALLRRAIEAEPKDETRAIMIKALADESHETSQH